MLQRLQLAFTTLRAMRQTARFTLALYTRRRYALVTSSGRVGCAVETST